MEHDLKSQSIKKHPGAEKVAWWTNKIIQQLVYNVTAKGAKQSPRFGNKICFK
jgi:hypothetical protein